MKTTLLRKGAVVFLSLLTTASLMAIPTAAAPLEKDPPKGYATKVPGKNDAGVLTYQDFETDKLNDEGLIGKSPPPSRTYFHFAGKRSGQQCGPILVKRR